MKNGGLVFQGFQRFGILPFSDVDVYLICLIPIIYESLDTKRQNFA